MLEANIYKQVRQYMLKTRCGDQYKISFKSDKIRRSCILLVLLSNIMCMRYQYINRKYWEFIQYEISNKLKLFVIPIPRINLKKVYNSRENKIILIQIFTDIPATTYEQRLATRIPINYQKQQYRNFSRKQLLLPASSQ